MRISSSLAAIAAQATLKVRRVAFIEAPPPLARLLLIALLASASTAAALQPAVLVKDISPLGSSSPEELTVIGNRVLFTAVDNAERGRELWSTDGTEAGTVLVYDVNPDLFRDSLIRDLTAFRGKLYFAAGSAFTSGPSGVFSSDGTATGTGWVPGSSSSGGLTVAGSRLFFFTTGTLDISDVCWIGDDPQVTCAGTGLRLFVSPGVATAANGQLFFSAALGLGSGDTELWASDGSAGGTRLVRDIRPGGGGSAPRWLTPLGADVYFIASDGQHDDALWRSDGSEAGTYLVKAFEPGASEARSCSRSSSAPPVPATATATAAWR